jgi:hypothetical protein
MTIWGNADLADRLNMGVARHTDARDVMGAEAAMRVAAARIMTLDADLRLLTDELSAMLGYMRNARIDLETGAPKATAIRTLSGGIKRGERALDRATGATDD